MARMSLPLYSLFALYAIIASVTGYREYGCYSNTPSQDFFYKNPGNYNISTLTPILCAQKCAMINYIYAALQVVSSQPVCYCSSTQMTAQNSLNYTGRCTDFCQGNTNLSCGGIDYATMYCTDGYLRKLFIDQPLQIHLQSTTNITFQFSGNYYTNYDPDAMLTVDYGDGWITPGIVPFSQTAHYYTGIGQIQFTVAFHNNITDHLPAVKHYQLLAPVVMTDIQCPTEIYRNQQFWCLAKVTSGNEMNVAISFEDGHDIEFPILDCKHTYVGDLQGITTKSLPSGRDDPDQATLLFPHYVIQRSGYIYHWEGNFKQTGKILFQVWRPNCSNQIYCPDLGRCISPDENCQPSSCDNQDSNITYCLSTGHCYNPSNCTDLKNINNINNTNPFDPSTAILVDQTEGIISKVGRVVLSEPQITPLAVQQGDFIGISYTGPGSGEIVAIPYQLSNSGMVYISNISHTNIDQSFNSSYESIDQYHYLIRAVVVESTMIGPFSYNYSTGGVNTINITAYNNVSQSTSLVDIEVKEYIEEVTIQVYDNATRQSGTGPNQNYFPVNRTLAIIITTLYGIPTNYSYNLGGIGKVVSINASNTDNDTSTVENGQPVPYKSYFEILYIYNTSGIANITVNASDSVSWSMASIQIELYYPVEIEFIYAHSYRVTVTYPLEVWVFLKQIGNFSVITWDPQDGSPVVTRNASEAVIASTVPKINSTLPDSDYLLHNRYVLIFNHTYYSISSFYLRIRAINPVTNITLIRRVRVRKCYAIRVSFSIPGGSTSSRPKSFRISRYIIFTGNVRTSCNFTDGINFNWTLTPYRHVNGSSVYSPPVQFPPTVLTNTTLLILPSAVISSAYNYTLYLRATARNSPAYGYRRLYITFTNNPLAANIVGGSYRTIGINQNFIVDASRSRDPDDINNRNGNLTYNWTCQIITNQHQLSTTVNSCLHFTQQQSQQPMLYVPSTAVLGNTTYLFQVSIYKDDRESKGVQLIHIVYDDPPTIEIICTRNCMNKVNPTDLLILEGRCQKHCDHLVYSWSVVNTTIHWNTSSSTGNNKEYVTFLEDTFINKTHYVIQLSVTSSSGLVSLSYYNITINSPPTPGACTVRPTEGITLMTFYTIHCHGFKDDDKHLSYQFRLANNKKDGDHHIEAYYSSISEVSLILPAGQESNGYKLPMEVVAVDTYGASTTVPLTITVYGLWNYTLKEELSAIANYTIGNASMLRYFIDHGRLQEANLAAGISAKMLNNMHNRDSLTGSEDEQKRSTIRNHLAQNVLNNVNTMQTLPLLKQTVDAIIPVTQVKQELSDTAQDTISNSFQYMTDMLNSEGKNGANDALLKSTAKGIIKTANNIIAAAKYIQQNPGTIQPTMTSSVSKLSNIIDKSVKAIKDSFTVILMNEVPGEVPTTIESGAINVSLSRYTYKHLPRKIGEIPLGSFKLPKPEFLLPNIINVTQPNGDPIFIDYRWSAIENPFTYVPSSAHVADNINGLSLTFANGSDILIRDLSHPIDVRLPQSFLNIENLVNRTADQATPLYIQCSAYRCQNPKHYIDIVSNSGIQGFLIVANQPLQAELKLITSGNATHSISNYSINNINTLTAYHLAASPLQPGRYFLELQYQAPLIYGNKSSRNFYYANYSLTFYDLGCRFWNKTISDWSSSGCKVVADPNNFNIAYCRCDHLTFFAGRFDVTPNLLDFSKIQHWFADIHNNPYIVIVLACMYVLFFLIAIWAWRRDKKNTIKFSTTYLIDNQPDDLYRYEITVFTGLRVGSGTTANVSLIISGENQDTSPRLLKDFTRPLLQTRDIDTMILTCSEDLGPINYVRLYHDNSGSSPSWFLSRIIVKDLQSKQQYCFICNKWLAVDADDGLIDRTLYPATKEELRDFIQLFMSKAAVSLNDNHIWLSIVTRPAKSHFTRLQRVGSCFSILLLSMLTNAMFYRDDIGSQDSAGVIFIGKIITWDGLIRGLISGAIVFLPSFLMVQLFRLSRSKPNKKANVNHHPDQAKPINHPPEVQRDLSQIKLTQYNDIGKRSDANSYHYVDDDNEQEKGWCKINVSLPWWCIYVGWGLVVVSCGVGTAFTLFYGLSFGSELCLQWLASLTISILQSILILQPIKVIVVAFIFAVIIRRPDLGVDINKFEDNGNEDTLSTAINVKDIHPDAKQYESHKFLPLEASKVNAARNLRLKQRKMQSIFKETLGYLIFLIVTILICYGNRDSNAYYQTKSLYDIFAGGYYNSNTSKIGSRLKGFAKITSVTEFWEWTNEIFLPGLYIGAWYNGQPPSSNLDGFLTNRQSYLVGIARIRMLRVNRGVNCQIDPAFNTTIHDCTGPYTYGGEDRKNYTVSWQSISHIDERDPWHFQTSTMTGSYPYWGQYHIYYGGGYVAELNRNVSQSQQLLNQLHQHQWIDHQTRAIFIEFTVFNAQVNLFSVVTLLAEFPATGGIMPFVEIQTIRLFRDQYSAGMLVVVCEIIFISFIAYYIYREVNKLRRLSFRYFSGFWNLIEFTIISLALAAGSIFFFRLQVTKRALTQCRIQSHRFINFHYVATWDNLFIHIFAFLIFFGTIKLIRLLRFNRTIAILSITLRSAAKEILMFLIVFSIIFLSFAQFAFLIYGNTIDSYNTFIKTLESQFNMMIGRFYAKIMYSSLRDVSPIYFFCYIFLVSWVLINMFLTLIIKSFEKVKSCCNQINQDLEMADYMKQKFKSLVGKKSNKVDQCPDTSDNLSPQQLRRRYTIVQNRLDDLLVCVNRLITDKK